MQFLPEIKLADFIIAADRGGLVLVNHKIIPQLALGDFDSVNKREFQKIQKYARKLYRFKVEKDQTDLEIAIDEAVELKPKEIRIYGASGTRLDHTLAAMQLLEKYSEENILIRVIDKNNEIILASKKYKTAKSKHKYLSLLPVTEKAIVSLESFRYPVSHKHFLRGTTLGISNEIIGAEGKVTVHKGKILIIKSLD